MTALRLACAIAGGPAKLAKRLNDGGYRITVRTVETWLYCDAKHRPRGYPPPEWAIHIAAAVDNRVTVDELIAHEAPKQGNQ